MTFLLSSLLPIGWWARVVNANQNGLITFSCVGVTVDGQPSMTLDPGCTVEVVFHGGTSFATNGISDGGIF